MTEHERRWRLFGNGLLQAIYSGTVASMATLGTDWLFDLQMNPKQLAAAIAPQIVAYVWGWLKNNELPPIFQVDGDQIETLGKVVDVVKTADQDIAAIVETAESDIADLTKKN